MAQDIKEGILPISSFHGLDQTRGEHGNDYGSSPDEENFVARFGFLTTFPGVHAEKAALPVQGAKLFQAFFRNADGTDKTYIMASGGGKLYYLNGNNWTQLGAGFSNDDWHFVNYRHEADDWTIMTNGVQCLKYWDGKSSSVQSITPKQGGQPIVFSHITLIYERLWGAVYASQPDRIYWSESFAPDDWEINYDTPDAGGGFVDVATFDGSRIRAITAAFDDILIFKDKSMHRLNGTYPGEFNLTQVYGTEGTLAPDTVVTTSDRLYFLSTDGLCVYNGMTVASLAHSGDRKAKEVWKRINANAIQKATAVIADDIMYLALPLDGATENTHVVEYNLQDGTYSLVRCPGIKDWLLYKEGQAETLYCLIGNRMYLYGSGTALADGSPINAYWYTPIINAGTLASKKATGRIYMSVHAQSLDYNKKPQIKLTMISEKRERSKIIDLQNGTNLIRKRVKVRGRTFQMKIENVDGNPLRINKGMEIAYEEDSDI